MASRLTAILAGSTAVGVVLGACGFLLPGTWQVERTIEVHAPAPVVFRLVDTYEGWTSWAASWSQAPGLTFAPGPGPSSGTGTEVRWMSARGAEATLTVRSAEVPVRVDYDLVWANGIKVRGTFHLAAGGDTTEVTWTSSGEIGVNPIARWAAFLFHDTLGHQFDRGLEALAAEAQREAAEQEPPPVHDVRVPIEPPDLRGGGAAYEGP